MKKIPIFILLIFFAGCTQLTIPNLPIGQVSEAFKEGYIFSGQLVDRNTYRISLVYEPESARPGWNLVALPAGGSQLRVDVHYEFFHYEPESALYLTETDVSLTAGSAFWIKVTQPGTLTLKGPWQTTNTRMLQSGWNQFGVGFEAVKIKDITITNRSLLNVEDLIVPIFYFWDSKKGDWSFINARKPESTEKELLPGVGYFVYVKKESELMWG